MLGRRCSGRDGVRIDRGWRPAGRPRMRSAGPGRLFALGDWAGSPRHALAGLSIIFGCAAYAFLSNVLGFLILAPALLFIWHLAFGVNLKTAAASALITSAVTWTVFYKGLGVPLPWGLLKTSRSEEPPRGRHASRLQDGLQPRDHADYRGIVAFRPVRRRDPRPLRDDGAGSSGANDVLHGSDPGTSRDGDHVRDGDLRRRYSGLPAAHAGNGGFGCLYGRGLRHVSQGPCRHSAGFRARVFGHRRLVRDGRAHCRRAGAGGICAQLHVVRVFLADPARDHLRHRDLLRPAAQGSDHAAGRVPCGLGRHEQPGRLPPASPAATPICSAALASCRC